jgi:hypothetical protein
VLDGDRPRRARTLCLEALEIAEGVAEFLAAQGVVDARRLAAPRLLLRAFLRWALLEVG